MVKQYGRVVGSIVALGAALLMSACAVPVTPPAPPAVNQQPAPADQNQESDQSQENDPESGQETEQNSSSEQSQESESQESGTQEAEQDQESTDSGAQMNENIFVTSYDTATAKGVETAQKPDEFLPPDSVSSGPSELLLMDIEWARWDEQEARGNCIVRVTGGGAPPELVKDVRITLTNVQTKNGKQQYTHYKIEWPDGDEPDEGELNFPTS